MEAGGAAGIASRVPREPASVDAGLLRCPGRTGPLGPRLPLRRSRVRDRVGHREPVVRRRRARGPQPDRPAGAIRTGFERHGRAPRFERVRGTRSSASCGTWARFRRPEDSRDSTILRRQVSASRSHGVHVRGEPGSFAPRLRTVAAAVDPTLPTPRAPAARRGRGRDVDEFDFLFRLPRAGERDRPAPLARGDLLGDVVHRLAADARDRDPRRARRDPGSASSRRSSRGRSRRSRSASSREAAWCSCSPGWSPGCQRAEVAIVVAYIALMLGVCLLACIVPTRRALRVQPTEALRTDA